eukprot:420922-Amphidinium_carterae.1
MEYRHMVLKGAMASLAYLQHRVFDITNSYPWSLVRGDTEANLNALVAEENEPEDQVACQLWLCARAGVPLKKLNDVILLLGQASFSSFLVEKLHASAATVRKFHHDLGPGSLALRAFFHSFRQLLDVGDALQKRVSKTKQQMEQ